MNSDPVARWEEILRSRYWDELLALEDDLVGRAVPGDRVLVNGVLKFYPRRAQANKSTDFDLFFKSISVENMGVGG